MRKSKGGVMDLQKMYEKRLTPERKVEAFRRYVIKLKRQRSLNAELREPAYARTDIRLFREEALYMKGLQAERPKPVKLTKIVRCLEEMTDEQILYYYTLVGQFKEQKAEMEDLNYAAYYLLEVANLIYQDSPLEACEVLFSFWDRLCEKAKPKEKFQEYFTVICRLFMLSNPEVLMLVVDSLEKCTGKDFSGRLYEAIERGDYREAARYVRQNARLLKVDKLCSAQNYVTYTWRAMPYIFQSLEDSFAEYDFRHMILNGFYGSMYLGEYPVLYGKEKPAKRVQVSDYMYYEYQDFSDYWKFWYYILRESAQDLLCILYYCTESCVRKAIKAPNRVFSVNKLINKNYPIGIDHPKNVEKIKGMLRDPRFQKAIEEGVQRFFTAEQIVLPKKKSQAKNVPDLDYERVEVPESIDPKRLKKARSDAKSVLGMLSEGELNYESLRSCEIIHKKETEAKPAQDEEWKQEERQYLRYLREGKKEEAEHFLSVCRIPEPVMIKRINEKALQLMGDLLLEKEAGVLKIIEDYEADVDQIVREEA